jgi:hypothetical protein
MNDFLANLIWILHILFILWFVLTPFTNNKPMLALHFVGGASLFVHWALGQDTCTLTLIEQKLRGVECKDSFFFNLVSPIYKISDEQLRPFVWIVSLALWSVTVSKIIKDPSILTSTFTQAFKPFSEKTKQQQNV